jgi:RES domain-containing protein
VKVWRIAKQRYGRNAGALFDGEGSRLFGGRWTSVGTRAVYTSEHLALAAMEVLVHVDRPQLLKSYVTASATIPDDEIEAIDVAMLPRNWRSYPAPPELQAIGDAWVTAGRTLALKVPSVIVAGSWNVLLNPEHPSFKRAALGAPTGFAFDSRLK